MGQDYLYDVAEDDYEDENNPKNNKTTKGWFDYSIELISQDDGSSGNFLSIDTVGEKGTPQAVMVELGQ